MSIKGVYFHLEEMFTHVQYASKTFQVGHVDFFLNFLIKVSMNQTLKLLHRMLYCTRNHIRVCVSTVMVLCYILWCRTIAIFIYHEWNLQVTGTNTNSLSCG